MLQNTRLPDPEIHNDYYFPMNGNDVTSANKLQQTEVAINYAVFNFAVLFFFKQGLEV